MDLRKGVKGLSLKLWSGMRQQHGGDAIGNGAARAKQRGQAMVEYVITAGILLMLVVMLALLLYAFREYGSRVLDLVASEYP